ncbi:MAG TPA: nucleotidyltransferase domain-containing protein [Solirubrobacteraceae bacterium]|nr:nucleotidyltransferase domain-containing protein [Solirubrobacteraceae bacterium]
MFTQLADALAPASLSSTERRVVGRLVERLQEELGPNLHAIWLYGSRARAETPHAESDIDLMVIASGSTWNNGVRAIKLTQEVADAQGVSPVWYSTQVVDPDWIVGRREIHSFFIQEVDRDKIVLYGDRLE